MSPSLSWELVAALPISEGADLGVTQLYKNTALSNANPDCSAVLIAQYPSQRAGRPLFSSQT